MSLFKSRQRPSSDPIVVIQDPEPEVAWKTLSLVNEWIRFGDAKAGAAMAAAGVIGGVLYNLVHEHQDLPTGEVIASSACGLFTGLTVLFAALALLPQLRAKRVGRKLSWKSEDPTSPLYFDHIARAHDKAPSYAEVLTALTMDSHALTKEIAFQVHANAGVARRKYRMATRAIRCLVLALLLLGLNAFMLLHH